MATTVLSPNMNITVPVPGQQTGPDWATNLYNALYFTVDGHDHSSGNGAQIVSGSININADLSFNNYNLTNANTLRLRSNAAAIAASSPNLVCLYAAPNTGSGLFDLYYNDGAGNQIPITVNGGVAGTSGSITGLTTPASASYASSTITFARDVGLGADISIRSLILTNTGDNTVGMTLAAPTLSAPVTITLPAIPASGTYNFLTMNNSGTMASGVTVDGSTISIAANQITVPTGGIGTTQLASGSVTPAKKAALGQQTSSSSSNFSSTSTSFVDVTNLTATLTTTGRPVMIVLCGSGVDGASLSTSNPSAVFRVMRDSATAVSYFRISTTSVLGFSYVCIDTPTAASHTYTLQGKAAAGTWIVNEYVLTAYEL